MPDETFNNRPGDNPDAGAYVSTDPRVNYNLENQHLELLSQEVQRLRNRLGWLGGLSALALVLAGTLGGLLLNMKLQQDQQKQQLATLTSDKAGVESQISSITQQVTSLDQQVTSISKQVPQNLPTQIKVTQDQLKQLQASVKEINSKAVTSAQLNAALQQAQRNSNTGGQTLAPSNSLTLPTVVPSGQRPAQRR